MRMSVLRRPIVFLRVRCSILILLLKIVRCSIRSLQDRSYQHTRLYLTTPIHQSFEKLIVSQLVVVFLFYVTQKFITMYTTAHHLSLSRARCIQSKPYHLISFRSILISPPYPRLCLPGGLLPSQFPTNNVSALLSSMYISPLTTTTTCIFST